MMMQRLIRKILSRPILAVLVVYGGLSLFFLRGVLFKPGAIMGSDWSLPLTSAQMELFGSQGFYTWTNSYNLFGARLSHLNTYIFNSLFLIFSWFGISGAVVGKTLLFLLFVAIGFSAYHFARRVGLSFRAALLVGFIYLTTPLVFNYSIMGWIFLLWLMALLPFFLLAFRNSIETGKTRYALLAGLIFALAMFQSQAVVWFPLLMFTFLPPHRSRHHLFNFVRSFVIVMMVAVLLHANWVLPLIFSPDQEITRVVSGYDISRFESRLSYLNMIRLWGGLFNYQFETAFPKILLSISFILPILSVLALLSNRKNKKFFQLGLVALLPLLLYSLRSVLYRIPFSNVVRDFGRLMVLSALPYAVLAATAFEEIGRVKNRLVANLLSMGIVLSLFLVSFPFWSSELYGEPVEGHDQRLRTLEFPEGYRKAENFLLENSSDTRVLYLPEGMLVGFLDDERFKGSYKETVDIFALLSQRPGASGFSDKTKGLVVAYPQLILDAVGSRQPADLGNLLALTPIDSLVVRKNIYGAGGKGPVIEKMMESVANVTKVFDEPKVAIFKNDNFLPHFYIPKKTVYVGGGIEGLADVISFDNHEIRSGIYLTDRNSVASLPEIKKLRNLEILERADEVFVVGEREGIVESVLDPEWDEGWAWPEVLVRPGSWKYRLVGVKEWWAERRAKAALDRVDVLLWHAVKRVEEIEKFVPQSGTEISSLAGAEIGKLTDVYLEKVGETVGILKSIPEEERGEEFWGMVAKVLAYTGRAEEEIEKLEIEKFAPPSGAETGNSPRQVGAEIKKLHGGFREWVESVAGLDCEGEYCYEFEVPEGGSYEIFVDRNSAAPEIGNSVAAVAETGEIKKLEIEKFAPRGGAEISSLAGAEIKKLRNGEVEKLRLVEGPEEGGLALRSLGEGGWVSFGKTEFGEGVRRLELSLPEPVDLVDEGDLAGGLTFDGPIEGWEGGEKYEVSFDYRVGSLSENEEEEKDDGTRLNLALFEKRPDREDVEIWEKKSLLKESLGDTFGEWGHFNKEVKASFDAKLASIYLYASPGGEGMGEVMFRDVVVRKVLEPRVMLRKVRNEEIEKLEIEKFALPSGAETGNSPRQVGAEIGKLEIKKLETKKLRNSEVPRITFWRVNPTKYRVRVEGAVEPYTLVFSESFHSDWRLYIGNEEIKKLEIEKLETEKLRNSSRQVGTEIKEIAPAARNSEIVASYFDGDICEGEHHNTFLDQDIFETWGKKAIADGEHRLVNGYANSWYIRPEDVGGAEDYELIVEFAPQRLFYTGLFISILTLAGSLGYLIVVGIKKLRNWKLRN